ncbi:C-type lectin domain family 2 member L-like [Porphyrio hochstetteri]
MECLERGTRTRKGLCSNIWFWRAVAGVFAAVTLIVSILLAKCSSAKEVPVCPSLEPCPSGWLYFQGKCYYLSEVEDDWNSRKNFCSQHNASLLVIENHQELHSLAKLLKIDDCWIGLHKKGASFYWENGTALNVNLFPIQNHSNCAYLDAFSVSTSACSLPRRGICNRLP